MTLRTTINSKELEKMFRDLGSSAANLRPAMRKIGGVLERASSLAFERQGPGWKPLSPKYKAQKAKKFGASKKILELEGNLSSSVSAQLEGDRAVFIGSNLAYAAKQQATREFLVVTQSEIRKSIFIISKHLLRSI